MRRALLLSPLVPLLLLFACGDDKQTNSTSASASSGSSSSGAPDAGPSVDDILSALPKSCSFDCGNCAEPMTPFDCPTTKPWDSLPHDPACGAWDGKYPDSKPGKCTSSDAKGESARPAGPFAGGVVLPDGHRIQPAGRNVELTESDVIGGFPMSLLTLSGTSLALVSDGGIKDNALRLIDLDALAGMAPPVVAHVAFPEPSSLFFGLAWLPPSRAFASGGGDAKVYAFDVDTTQKTLARASAKDLSLGLGSDGSPFYVSAIAATGDGLRLFVAPSDHDDGIHVLSLGAADYGKELARIAIKSHVIFDLERDPFATGDVFYASDEMSGLLYEIDGATSKITREIKLERNPAQIAFLDATYLVVAESNSDSISVVNRATGTVDARVPVFEDKSPRGFSPTALTYDATSKRLYTTLAAVNAIEAYDVTPGTPPKITPAGRVPTAWWPTAVAVAPDGSLAITNGKGVGTGTDGKPYTWGKGPITDLMHGSVQGVPAASLVDLTPLSKIVDDNRNLGGLADRPQVTCPNGADDFPIPDTNTKGPSKQIQHVIFVVRENKTYDAVFGDRPDLGNGDPKLIMAPTKELQDAAWKNARLIASTFTNMDNFYTDAEQSLQGHTWTAYGRMTDFMERGWLSIWGRGTRQFATPTLPVAEPEEGSVFTWLTKNNVPNQDMGEIVGEGVIDTNYPGIFYGQNIPDIDKSCYIDGRIRLLCDLKSFTYVVQSNDHTYGGSKGQPSPEVMIAVNDEAIGMLLDGLSHSPIWKDSLLIVTEDDPQDGGDHVDQHRSLLFMASPWVKRKYVSHGHYDMGSVYKLVAHVFGVPYNNEQMRNAILPVDAFTSTPDFTPYTYVPRSVASPCNKAHSREAIEAEAWDFTDVDDQPGLSQQIERMMKDPDSRGVRIVR